jgi:hypothetical protein
MRVQCVYQIKSFAELADARASQLFTAKHRSFDENLRASLKTNHFMQGKQVKNGGFGRPTC